MAGGECQEQAGLAPAWDSVKSEVKLKRPSVVTSRRLVTIKSASAVAIDSVPVLEILLAAPARHADRGLGDPIVERRRRNTVATGSQIVISVV